MRLVRGARCPIFGSFAVSFPVFVSVSPRGDAEFLLKRRIEPRHGSISYLIRCLIDRKSGCDKHLRRPPHTVVGQYLPEATVINVRQDTACLPHSDNPQDPARSPGPPAATRRNFLFSDIANSVPRRQSASEYSAWMSCRFF